MGIVSSRDPREAEKRAEMLAKARSNAIDLGIEYESKFKRNYDVLLISIPESEAAASGLIKRIGCLLFGHLNDEPAELTYKELANLRPVIWKILLRNSRSVVIAIRSRNLGPTRPSNKANIEYIMNHRIDTISPDFSFLPKFGQAVQDLWTEEIIPILLDHPHLLSVDDDAAYFFTEAQRIVAEDYLPSIEDSSHASERRVKVTSFTTAGLSIRISQVCQRGERRKWIHLFEGISSMIFYASLPGYDERIVSWKEQTRQAESFVLFEAVVNSRWFLRTSVILFLADIAAFRTKLHEVPLAQYYPEYTGGTNANKGAKYIFERFMHLNRARLNIYPHITEVSDASNMRLVFAAMRETVFQSALKAADIL